MMHGGPGTAREKAVRVGRTVHSPAAITPTLTLPLKGGGDPVEAATGDSPFPP